MDIEKSITVDQPVGKLWQIMATDYTSVGEWTSTVNVSKPNGAVTTKLEGAPAGGRVCTAPGFGDIEETLTRFDEKHKIFSYKADASGMPGFVKGLHNTWSFRPLGPSKTEVTMRIEVELNAFLGTLVAPVMRAHMSKVGKVALEELKYYAKTGRIHPRKVRALQKAGRVTVAA